MEEKGNVVTKLKKIINANGLGFLGKIHIRHIQN